MHIQKSKKKQSKSRRSHGLTFEPLQSRQLMAADLFAAADTSANLLLPAVQKISSYSVSGIVSSDNGPEAKSETFGDIICLRDANEPFGERGITLDVEANDTIQNAIGGDRPEARS